MNKRKKAEAKAAPEEMGEVDGLPVQALWPLGIIAAGGGLFALYKVDPGMEPLFSEAVKVRGTCVSAALQTGCCSGTTCTHVPVGDADA